MSYLHVFTLEVGSFTIFKMVKLLSDDAFRPVKTGNWCFVERLDFQDKPRVYVLGYKSMTTSHPENRGPLCAWPKYWCPRMV